MQMYSVMQRPLPLGTSPSSSFVRPLSLSPLLLLSFLIPTSSPCKEHGITEVSTCRLTTLKLCRPDRVRGEDVAALILTNHVDVAGVIKVDQVQRGDVIKFDIDQLMARSQSAGNQAKALTDLDVSGLTFCCEDEEAEEEEEEEEEKEDEAVLPSQSCHGGVRRLKMDHCSGTCRA
eukprot:762924-Hanusia_phi.AAC.2